MSYTLVNLGIELMYSKTPVCFLNETALTNCISASNLQRVLHVEKSLIVKEAYAPEPAGGYGYNCASLSRLRCAVSEDVRAQVSCKSLSSTKYTIFTILRVEALSKKQVLFKRC